MSGAPPFRHTLIPVDVPPGTLCWRGDTLVDWVRGGDAWALDGTPAPRRRGWGYRRFDGATADETGDWAVVFERCGTPALLLHHGEILRRLHRDPYHADDFLYPACLFRGPDGRTLLAHCPDTYDRIELDDALTGERLTRSDRRAPADFFHSRLAASPDGRRLLSAGWVWHPWDAVVWFDVATALADPTHLDAGTGAPQTRDVCLTEETSAAWLDDDRILLGSSAEPEDPETVAELEARAPGAIRPRPCGIAVYDVGRDAYTASVQLGLVPGAMLPVGLDHVVTFAGHPRLWSLHTGELVGEWPQLPSGTETSSIVRSPAGPALAIDRARQRFAVAHDDAIHVVTFDPPTR